MLMRICDTSDYDRSLRRRRLLAFGLLAVGLTGVLCYFFLIARGFYLGGSSGICIGAVLLLVRVTYLLSDPDARKKAKIQEQDEREKAIVHQSFQFAGIFTFFAAAASLFVLVAVNMAAAITVIAIITVYAVTWLIANLYLCKKL